MFQLFRSHIFVLSGLTLVFMTGAKLEHNIAHAGARPQQTKTISTIPVDQRRPDALKPKGMILRGFKINPELKTSIAYDDNIFNAPSDVESDIITSIRPTISALKEYGSHKFSLELRGNIRRFHQNSTQDTEEIEFSSDNKLTLTRKIHVPLNFEFKSTNLRRSRPGDARFTREPLTKQQYNIQSGINYRFNRLNLRLLGGYQRRSFEDGVSRITGNPVIFSANNRDIYTASFGASYHILARSRDEPEHILFADLRYQQSHFDQQGGQRDSEQIGILAGLKTEYKDMIFGTLSAGAFTKDFEAPQADAIKRLDFKADLQYLMTPKLMWIFSANRSVDEDNEFTRGFVESRFRLGYDYELQHDLYTGANINYQNDDFIDSQREDSTYSGNLYLRYIHSAHLESRIEITHKTRTSTDQSNEFDQNVIMYTLKSSL